MGNIDKLDFNSMSSSYYLDLTYTFDNSITIECLVEVQQLDNHPIELDGIAIVGIVSDSADVIEHLQDDWAEEVIEAIHAKITIESTLAMRIKATRKCMDELGIGTEDDTVKKQNSQSQFGKDEYPEECLEELNEAEMAYQAITNPVEFIKNFKTTDLFYDWCNEGSITDLKACLKVFEKAEVYEHCAIIRDCIQDKIKKL